MTTVERSHFAFDNTYARELTGLYEPWRANVVADPRLLAFNDELADELGLDSAFLRSPDGVAVLVGNVVPDGAEPIAQAYSGHQFGGFSPRLGDGRALLLGELIDVRGRRRDIHLKGSGRTPFARGGDGKAAIGPMLREFIMGEAMHALGVPTTRALAVVATGESIARESLLPGAVLARVASSHLRVGTFQFAATTHDNDLLKRLADYAIARHYPEVAGADNPYLSFYERVVDAQAALIARWMNLGFIHGVMNTDNMTISGETIDYGPCAFMDAFNPETVFSSIDHQGRYAYGNQPMIGQWNLARLAEAIVTLFDDDTDTAVKLATDVLVSFTERFHTYWLAGMRAKLGFDGVAEGDVEIVNDLLALLHSERVDFTSFFRTLSRSLRGDSSRLDALFANRMGLLAWMPRWRSRLGADDAAVAERMDAVNPMYVPRNHLVEEALAAGTHGDLSVMSNLLEVLSDPYSERAGLERWAEPAPIEYTEGYATFCGT
ncbi:MAG: hypothetical protein B7C54_05410 [Acidimicrobiales bacterium mtb01]|nr:YdiU family protein [Actinomycetota bacterium]TEX46639.1 MAG: hypothetical protein B7C54_05410 [Acidimicrobiales bacterium mtb01]